MLLVDVASHCEGGLRKMLEIRFAERPSHDVKWPLLMAEMKVDLTGLKAAAWNYWESSHLVVSWWIIPLAWFRYESFDDC